VTRSTTPPNPPKLLTALEVADRLGLTLRAVYLAAQRGQLPTVHLGRRLRFPEDAITRAQTRGLDT